MMMRHVVLVAILAMTANVSSARERPFKASFSGNAHLSPTDNPAVLRNDETGSGTATHLGKFTWTDVEFADFAAIPGGAEIVGAFTMTAANGDKLYGVFTATGLLDSTGMQLALTGQFQFIGGTGRFEDAEGEGELNGIGHLTPGLPFEATMDGTIDY